MLTATNLKALLAAHQLRLTKRLGQHHLVDPRVIERVVEACSLSRYDTVVEIGAGLGALTEPLAQRAGGVVAVEVDKRICAILAKRMAALKNVSVAHQDILTFSWDRIRDAVVVGAIPYRISSPIIVSLCEHRQAIREAILILQREVSQRLLAKPKAKAYGRLSILAQYYWQIRVVLDIPRHAFFPQPDVDSCCLRLISRPQPSVEVKRESVFFDVVKAAFSQRRKTLANCLCAPEGFKLARADAEMLLRDLGISPSVRGEALSLGQFAALANLLAKRLQDAQ